MILTSDEIKTRLLSSPLLLIENHGHPLEEFLEGGAYDLRVSNVYKLDSSYAYIGVKKRSTPSVSAVDFAAPDSNMWKLPPFEVYLVQTVETVNVPSDLRGIVFPRTTIFRSRWILTVGPVHPGYRGSLTFLLSGVARTWLWLQLEARIASIIFTRLTGDEPHLYDGVWQGGRVGTEGKEERGY